MIENSIMAWNIKLMANIYSVHHLMNVTLFDISDRLDWSGLRDFFFASGHDLLNGVENQQSTELFNADEKKVVFNKNYFSHVERKLKETLMNLNRCY